MTKASAAKWLSPAAVRARWDAAAARLSVRVGDAEEAADVRVGMAFPVTAPGRFIDLGNDQGESIGMLRSLEGLDQDSRLAIGAALEARYLIPKVVRVRELSELGPFVLCWRVETDRGERTFHTESPREAVRYQTPDRIRVTDLAGNHYDFPSVSGMDEASRALLAAIL